MATANDITELTLAELAGKLARRELSATEATRASLQRTATLEPKLHAFLRIDEAGALAAASAADARLQKGQPLSPLDGVPVALKDIFVTRGLETTAGSRILQGFVPPFDGTAVAKLEAAGAVLTGKLAMDEFAMGSSNENTPFEKVRNPWDTTRVPGGSSGGSAASVAAREVFGSLGTDTGGSIRQPASLCGIAGLKPTYGRVSRYGVVAFASSLDQVGPMARTAEDCALILQAIAGHDPQDSTSADLPVPDYRAASQRGVKGLKIGVPREYFVEGMDKDVEKSVRAGIERLKALGAEIHDVSLPHTGYAVATYYIVATAEASSNLERYDGVKYGYRNREARGLKELYLKSRAEGFGTEVKRRIMLGTYVLSAGYYDAFYLKAQKVRTLISGDFKSAFEKVDAIVGPTSPVPAFKLGEKVNDPLQMYLADIFTISCNLAGLPGLSVPCGFTSGGLPVGLQAIGKPFDEEALLAIGGALERDLGVHRKSPPL